MVCAIHGFILVAQCTDTIQDTVTNDNNDNNDNRDDVDSYDTTGSLPLYILQ